MKNFEKLKKKLEGLHALIPVFKGSEEEKMIKEIRANFEKEAEELEERYMQIEIEYLQNAGSK